MKTIMALLGALLFAMGLASPLFVIAAAAAMYAYGIAPAIGGLPPPWFAPAAWGASLAMVLGVVLMVTSFIMNFMERH